MQEYRRLHDDHDGTFKGWLTVMFGVDGDAYIATEGGELIRFRTPVGGGGASPRTYSALKVLAEAIRLDNEALPRERPLGPVDAHGA